MYQIAWAIRLGYKFKFIDAWLFNSFDYFGSYVDTFYDIKANSTNKGEKALAKLMLNSLYGFFGQSVYTNQMHIVNRDTISPYSDQDYIELGNNWLYKYIPEITDLNPDDQTYQVNANVAIASNITSIAQVIESSWKYYVHESPYGGGGIVYYGDTDSIVTNITLPDECLGSELGYMKDEINGGMIKEAYFFGNKQYAYLIQANPNWLETNIKGNCIKGSNTGVIIIFTRLPSC